MQKDDLSNIENTIKEADLIFLAAPVYWANVPAVVKNLFDRLKGTVMKETKTFPKARLPQGKKYVFVTACNTPSPFCWIFGQSRGAIRAVNEFFKTAKVKCAGKYVCSNSYNNKEISYKYKRFLQKLFD